MDPVDTLIEAVREEAGDPGLSDSEILERVLAWTDRLTGG